MSGPTLAMTGGNSIPQLGFSVYQVTDGLEVSADVHALTHVSQKHHPVSHRSEFRVDVELSAADMAQIDASEREQRFDPNPATFNF